MHLQRAGKSQRLLLRSGSLILTIECGQDVGLGYLVVEAIFIFDGLVGIRQGIVKIDLFAKQVSGRVVPADPRVLGKAAKLLFQLACTRSCTSTETLNGTATLSHSSSITAESGCSWSKS